MPEAPTLVPSLEAGRVCHRQGQLDQAQAIYAAILEAVPDHAEALHLLGVLFCQRGDTRRAVGLIGRAIALIQVRLIEVSLPERAQLRLTCAAAYNDLGCSWRDLGYVEEAEGCFRYALVLSPQYEQPLENLGDLLLAHGNLAAAIETFLKLIECAPTSVLARTRLGAAYLGAGQLDQAELCCYRAIDLEPGLSSAHNNLGTIYRQRKQLQRAEHYYREAVRLDPGNAEALHNLGVLCKDLGRRDQARSCLEAALRLRPGYADAHNSLGQLYAETGLFEEATTCYRHALRLRPVFAEALNNIANTMQALGRLVEAEDYYSQALTLAPTNAECQNNLALTELRAGKFKEGFRRYEWRWQIDAWPSKMPKLTEPLWQGETLSAGTLLIHCEQGYGDSIQFIRFLPLIRSHCRRLILLCQQPLKRLFQCLQTVAEVIGDGEPLPPFDRHLPLMSLARILETEIETIPCRVPYLEVSTDLVRHWQGRMGRGDGRPRVGLVWSTELRGPNDHERLRKSIETPLIHRLIKGGSARFYSLQKLSGGSMPTTVHPALIPIIDGVRDFADTAAIIANLDLVISIDTAVAHLAGALNVPTWVLLRLDSDWRWQVAGETTPWYPNMRLYRQPRPNDWASVIEAVQRALTALVEG